MVFLIEAPCLSRTARTGPATARRADLWLHSSELPESWHCPLSPDLGESGEPFSWSRAEGIGTHESDRR